MSMRLEVVRERGDKKLRRQRWVFWVTTDRSYQGISCFIDEYYEEERPSTRHKFRPKRGYKRIDRRYMGQFIGVEVEDVPLPEDVEAEALERIMDSIVVSRWNHR